MSSHEDGSAGRLPLALFLLSFGLYAFTAYPDVPGGDGGEIGAAVLTLGVPHPTGYPLYVLLGRIWTWVFPLGNEAFRLNLLSALFSAGAVAALGVLHCRLGRSRLAAAACALLFAVSPAPWSQSVRIEIYALQVLLTTLALVFLEQWSRQGDKSALWKAALLTGALLTNHATSVFLLPCGMLVLALDRKRIAWRADLWRLAALAALPLSLYLLLLIRSGQNPPVDSGNPENIGNLIRHISGAKYESRIFPLSWNGLSVNAAYLFDVLKANLPLLGWIPATAGLALLARRKGSFGPALVLLGVLQALFCLVYKVQGLVVFTLPALLALNLGLGEAVGYLERRRPGGAWVPAWVPGAALLLVVAVFGRHGFREQDQSSNQAHPAFAADLLDSLPYGSQVLSAGDLKTYALLWKQVAEQRRTDVSVLADNGEIFQGYQSFDGAKPEYFSVEEPAGSLAAGRVRQVHGMLWYVGPSKDRPLPDPWRLSRPVPTLEDVRRLGSHDLSAREIGINMEVARWLRATSEGQAEEAQRYLELSLTDSEALNSAIIPRYEEINFAFRQALKLQRWSAAVRWGQELLARGETDGRTLNNIAWALFQSGDSLAQAEQVARRAVALNPDRALFLDTLVRILDRSGRRDEARQILSEALRRNPGDAHLMALALEMFPGEP